MSRVAAQGDTRPMAASREAMADLRRILAGRAAFYAKADATLDTSGRARTRASPACARWSASCSAQRCLASTLRAIDVH